MSNDVAVIVTAYNEADRITATLAALKHALPGTRILVADDGSRDDTPRLARAAGARVIPAGSVIGKGGAATLAARRLLDDGAVPDVVLFCDGDLGVSAASLSFLIERVQSNDCDLAVAVFARRVGGGFGVAVGFARWAVRRLTGVSMGAPISGQRAVRGDRLAELLPFAPRFGMEIGMTVDAARAGLAIAEYELALEHRASRRTVGGFVHRGRQLVDFALVYRDRTRRRGRDASSARDG